MNISRLGTPVIQNIAFHHSASKRGSGKQLNAINTYHKEKFGVLSTLGWYVGYNFLIEADGTYAQTRKVGEEQTAQIGHNCSNPSTCDTMSVCLAGDFNQEMPTDAQVKTFREIIASIKVLYPDVKLVGHRDLQAGRTCPGALISSKYMQTVLGDDTPKRDATDKEKAEKIGSLRTQINLLQRLLALLKIKYK